MRERGGESGQASVELVALLPLIAALVIGAWQAVVAVQAWSLAGSAARAAARAVVVGADPAPAARAALPDGWARRVRVRTAEGGEVTVRIAVPLVALGVRLADARATVGTAAALPSATGEAPRR